MRSYLFALLFTSIMFGDFLTSGYFDAPTGERVWWKWFDQTLIVLDSNGQCLSNTDGNPIECTNEEISKIMFNI